MAVINKTDRSQHGTYVSLSSLIYFVETTLKIVTRNEMRCIDGQWIMETYLKPRDANPYLEWTGPLAAVPFSFEATKANNMMQAEGSAITYARRYSLECALGIAGTDNDGETSGGLYRDDIAMSTETKQQIDMILAKENVPKGYEDKYLSGGAGAPVTYKTLSEPIAQRIIDNYTTLKTKKEEPTK